MSTEQTKIETEVKTKTEPKKEVKKGPAYIAPFGFAFGPKVMERVPNTVDGKEYTLIEIIDILKNFVNELHMEGASLHYLENKNLFVLSNTLQKKG